MPLYTDEQDITFDLYPPERALVVEANGGSLVISVYNGSDWVVSDTITEDSTSVIFTAGLRFKFTPADGAVYNVSLTSRTS